MIRLVIAFLLIPSLLFGATVYVDTTLQADITDGSYSIASRNGSGSDGDAYHTLQAAIWGTNGSNPGASAGDTIYLRGGTYQEGYGTGVHPTAMELSTALNGTAGADPSNPWAGATYTTIASYPGEWAVLDGGPNDATYLYTIGYGEQAWSSGAHPTSYVKYERLGITGGAAAGIGLKKGPIWVQCCYIHGNGKDPHSIADNIQAGINAIRPTWCIIEYNYFSDNGNEGVDGTTNSNHINLEADYLYTSYTFDFDNCNRDNEIRYNRFDDATDAYYFIKEKAQQFLAERSDPSTPTITSMTYKNHGNRVHHNIGSARGGLIGGGQDFEQVHNNIIDGGFIASGEDGSTARHVFCGSVYNNTIIGGYAKCTIGYGRPETTLDLAWFCANNVIAEYGTYDYSPSIGVATMWNYDDCGYDYTWTDTVVDRNLIYKPGHASYHIGLPNSYNCKSTDWITTSAFNTLRSATNYTTATDGLFLGESGANQYIADESFSVADGVTIANGGIGGSHPYLSGVSIPSYVGAVNPSDSDWVAGVLALDTTYFTSATAGSDPAWIEGSDPEPTPTTTCTGCTGVGVTFN